MENFSMNTCKCSNVKEFRAVKSNNPTTYQCMDCKKIFLEKDMGEEFTVVGLQKTDNPFKFYVRKPVKKD